MHVWPQILTDICKHGDIFPTLFCLSIGGSDSFVNIDTASIKTLSGNYLEYFKLYMQLSDKRQVHPVRCYWILYSVPTWKGCLTSLSSVYSKTLACHCPVFEASHFVGTLILFFPRISHNTYEKKQVVLQPLTHFWANYILKLPNVFIGYVYSWR